MIIKETNDPKTLKRYIRYVVEKYHDLAEKYIELKDINLSISSENQCIKIENVELIESNKAYMNEIKNLYSLLSDKKFVDNLSTNVLELDSQLKLFHEDVEESVLPIIDFHEVMLDADNDNNYKILSNNDKKETYDNRF